MDIPQKDPIPFHRMSESCEKCEILARDLQTALNQLQQTQSRSDKLVERLESLYRRFGHMHLREQEVLNQLANITQVHLLRSTKLQEEDLGLDGG